MDRNSVVILGLAFELAGLIVGFLFLGREIDSLYQLKGIGIAGGAFLGFAIWIAHLVVVLSKQNRE